MSILSLFDDSDDVITPREGEAASTVVSPQIPQSSGLSKLKMALVLMGILNLSHMPGCNTAREQDENCLPSEVKSVQEGDFEANISNQLLTVTAHSNIETGNGLKIRQTADPNGTTIGRLHTGDQILVKKSKPVCNEQGDIVWMGEVETSNGTTGWVIISTINYVRNEREYYLIP